MAPDAGWHHLVGPGIVIAMFGIALAGWLG